MKISLLIMFLLCSSVGTLFSQVNITDLERPNGVWTKPGESSPYTGEFVEYFPSRNIKGKGYLENGVIEGFRVMFTEQGDTAFIRNYRNGIPDGLSREFYPNGKVRDEGSYQNGQKDGSWIGYYETGEKAAVSNFKNGVQHGDYLEYDVNGRLTTKYVFDNGKPGYGKYLEGLIAKALEHSKRFETKEAIEVLDEAIVENPTIAHLYFYRGTNKSNSLNQYPEAIADYDKAIELNPEFMEAYANRGSAKLNLYRKKMGQEMDPMHINSICADYRKAQALGDKSIGTSDIIEMYCGSKSIGK